MRVRGDRAVAIRGDADVVVTGDHSPVTLVPRARSAYWEQVKRIVPPRCAGRESELAALADICRAADGPSHTWLRGGAWAGKTGLLSWFALHPPPGVRIVPFFVTAHYGAYNGVAAYVEIVMEQLAELVGESLPAHLTAAGRETQLLRLYAEAAHACAARGERLVLLVDGLDEDCDATTGPAAHSIASLLPAAPRAGMRILVSSRDNLPLPTDVPEGHPLRAPAAEWPLTDSPHAQVVRAQAERELNRLLADSEEADLLGLVTAARGGLTVADLAALTGRSPYWVKDTLRTRAGRSFAVREGACLLAHEALDAMALEVLEGPALDGYRLRLHAWADDWRARGWPPETPAYLLRGYFRMLQRDGDRARVVRCALDEARHDRMLAVTGADASAMAELDAAERRLIASDDPDTLLPLFRLDIHRDRIRGRSHGRTETLAWAWAALGQPSRAEAVARGLTSPVFVRPALARVAEELARQGHTERATALAAEAEASQWRQPDRPGAAADAVLVHRALASVGLHERADAVLRTPRTPLADADLAPRVVEAWLAYGEFERALAAALAQSAPGPRASCLRALVRALLVAGEEDRAVEVFLAGADGLPAGAGMRVVLALTRSGRAEEAKALWRQARWRGVTLRDVVDVAGVLAEAGHPDEALHLFDEIADGADGISSQHVALLLVRSGELDSAEALLTGTPGGDAASALAGALARRGEVNRVKRFLRTVLRPAREEALAAAVEGLAATGRFRAAESLAGWDGAATGLDPLARGAVTWARAGHKEEALAFLARVEDRVRDRAGTLDALSDRARVARELAVAGHRAAAREVLTGIEEALRRTGPYYRPYVASAARALAHAGEVDRAGKLIDRLLRETEGNGSAETEAWPAFVRACVAAGRYERAEETMTAARGRSRDVLLAGAMAVLAECGERARAVECAVAVRDSPWLSAVTKARALHLRGLRDEARLLLAAPPGATGTGPARSGAAVALELAERFEAWAAIGDRRRAGAVADEVLRRRRATWEISVGWRLVRALVRSGLHDRAKWFVRHIPQGDAQDSARESLVEALVEAGETADALNWARPFLVRGSGFADAAAALVPAVDAGRGRSLALHALREGEWSFALPALLHLEPAAVPLLVDAFRDRPTAARTSAPSATSPHPAAPAASPSPRP
ncbi:hypothetical protein [Streptomyces sp. NPDC087300]|uniref:hypothetical protein n=1 Tax=Streptomyces sp. NPDC087300 TaxID=3365780 RepID=UPI003803C4D2